MPPSTSIAYDRRVTQIEVMYLDWKQYLRASTGACDASVESVGSVESAGSALARCPFRHLASTPIAQLHTYLDSYVDLLGDNPRFFLEGTVEHLSLMARHVFWPAHDSDHFH